MERTKLFGWGFFIIIVTARDNSIFNTGVCGELFGWLVFLLFFFLCVVFFCLVGLLFGVFFPHAYFQDSKYTISQAPMCPP